jgi:hypothetical protein
MHMLKSLFDLPFQGAAISSSYDSHLLDHIAPLASLCNMPLIFNEEKNHELLERYYPEVTLEYEPNLEIKFPDFAEKFDTLFSCQRWPAHVPYLFETLYNKKMRLIFCPHGQSDKGFKSPILHTYIGQQMVLLYGKLHLEMLEMLEILPSVGSFATVGNYRLHYYLKHKAFFDQLVSLEILSQFAHPQNPILLYAPTWNDRDESTSFFDWAPFLIDQLPSHWNLIVKPHPLLETGSPAKFYRLLSQFEHRSNVVFLSDFPLVYPILNQTTAYLGDFSSVGYDFLHFLRPMFFFQNDNIPNGPLRKCGQIITKDSSLFPMIEQELKSPQFTNAQKALYAHAFEA